MKTFKDRRVECYTTKDALENKRYRKSLKNEWKGLQEDNEEGGSKAYPGNMSIPTLEPFGISPQKL